MRYAWFALWLGVSVGLWTAFLIGALALFRWLTSSPDDEGMTESNRPCWCGRGR